MIQGSRRRVGNGSKINIWQDKWLPMAFNQKVISPRTILPTEARLADLIDTSSFQPRWKGTLIDFVFYPFEVDIIKSIPLNFRLPPDSWIWTKNKVGTSQFVVLIFFKGSWRMLPMATWHLLHIQVASILFGIASGLP